jgi:hypothetical protein
MITPATGTKLKTKTMIPKLSSWGMFMIAKQIVVITVLTTAITN